MTYEGSIIAWYMPGGALVETQAAWRRGFPPARRHRLGTPEREPTLGREPDMVDPIRSVRTLAVSVLLFMCSQSKRVSLKLLACP